MSNPLALVVDDEPDIRQLLGMTLQQLGVEVEEAPDLAAAYLKLEKNAFDLCLTDMRLPDGNGLDLIQHIQQNYPDIPVAMITAYGNTEIAVDALKLGAFDFVSKPVQLPKLRAMVTAALKLATEPRDAPEAPGDFIGSSTVMQELRDQITRVARSQAPIYISGESGSGKEVVARRIHYQGPRADGPFVPVNCGAIPSELMESEFFGHKKGSFTGAYQDKQGLFQAADGGTLFLDEVADLPLSMQVKLLRGIQERAVRPVGTDSEIPVDIRIISASHKNLTREVELNHFRQDLYYRINVIELRVPSLRDRREDIPELVDLFLRKNNTDPDSGAPRLASSALSALLRYHFPGNVRELENTLERAATLCDGNTIIEEDLQLQGGIAPTGNSPESSISPTREMPSNATDKVDGPPAYNGGNLDEYLASVEKHLLEEALASCRWNKTAAAEKLGISFRQLRYKLKKLGVD